MNQHLCLRRVCVLRNSGKQYDSTTAPSLASTARLTVPHILNHNLSCIGAHVHMGKSLGITMPGVSLYSAQTVCAMHGTTRPVRRFRKEPAHNCPTFHTG